MKYLMIENEGTLELTGLRLMGASSKREQAKIGTFGTGWKYAAACILRHVPKFYACLGNTMVAVATTETTLRGQAHQEVCFAVDDSPGVIEAGFTTGLGPHWQPWMALRELISNGLDEGGLRVEVVDDVSSATDRTRVYVPFVEPFIQAWEARHKYFRLDSEPNEVVLPGLGRILPKQADGARFYKRGIFIKELEADAKHDYDFEEIELGEDRLPRGDVKDATWKLLDAAPVEVKREVLSSQFEASCYPYHSASPGWRDAFGDLAVVTEDKGIEGQLVVAHQFEHLATAVGARTKANDLATKAADRQTTPADGRVRKAAAKLAKLGVNVPPQIVLLAVIDRPFLLDGGLIYVNKALDEDGIFCALACAGTAKGWVGSTDHLMTLARLLLR